MAARRKVNNLMALAVLSTVIQRPMHPYEIASIMKARGKDRDMPIKWGSLYTVVGNLEKHGFIEAAENSRSGSRPERTVYRITEAGIAELRDWTGELLGTPEPEQTSFEAGLSVLAVLSPDEVIDLLRARLARLTADLAEQRAEYTRTADEIPRLLMSEWDYSLALLAAQAEWVRSFLAELTSGEMPGIAQWRAWRETGEIPADLAELAERGATED
ncbi:MAG TPA: PadR family transcriptional regulator [Pseudonocardiaceae bacterium]|nr:PadR family transcriptional regulator [Pseudonocardiaceae bacterium]